MKNGLKLGNGAVVQARMIVWNKEKLDQALHNLTDSEEKRVNLKLVQMNQHVSRNNYNTLIAVEEITQASISTVIPLTDPETAKSIITAFTNEADVDLGYYVYHAHQTHEAVEPVAFSGQGFGEGYSDILSMVRCEIFVTNGEGIKFQKLRPTPNPEPEQYPQQARALTIDERVANLNKQFLEIWNELCCLLPVGDYRVIPQFKVCSLDEGGASETVNSLRHVLDIANAIRVLEKLNVDGLPLAIAPHKSKHQNDAQKREVILNWVRKNTEVLTEIMQLDPIVQEPTLEHRANNKVPV